MDTYSKTLIICSLIPAIMESQKLKPDCINLLRDLVKGDVNLTSLIDAAESLLNSDQVGEGRFVRFDPINALRITEVAAIGSTEIEFMILEQLHTALSYSLKQREEFKFNVARAFTSFQLSRINDVPIATLLDLGAQLIRALNDGTYWTDNYKDLSLVRTPDGGFELVGNDSPAEQEQDWPVILEETTQ